ncbi:cysteine-rich receptor-like protein kinase 8 [Citrus sinensis]|uniref:cysteine-rich receptor-like protein kinase 8 n=1 Tax=Citrus sinensis TaxID=2711 RepID=UPI002278C77E|nr:cysteine-rich receptor-like protein kinase 8 [Citrus sinensis]
MLLLVVQFFMLSIFTDANPLDIACSNTSYAPNSPFESSLKLLLESIATNTSQGFYNFSIGDDPNRVFGRALCRGDVNRTVCQNCLENARHEILKNCKTAEEAIIWYELCQIQYSYRKFLVMVYAGQYAEKWNNQWKSVSNPARFIEVLTYLMTNLSIEASSDPAMFAVGEVKFPKRKTIYGLVQCTRDINSRDCNDCLTGALGDLKACCGAREAGIIVNENCNLRFQLSLFYNASTRISLTYPTSTDGKWKTGMVVAVACISTFVLVVLIGSYVVHLRRKKGAKNDEKRSQRGLLHELAGPISVSLTQEGDLVSSEELPFVHLAVIKAATDGFSDSNKLGQGGFGTVYKGVLPNGKEVAVKRLSRKSWQGLEEFKNEIILIAKLQHRNLVRLVGCGIEGEEKLLIYELMPNRSLDCFIFDSERRLQLNWNTCYNIIGGIAKGLLYLHEDSRLKIIHRDLKPNNVLLDKDMVAKISDFGMARIFCENQKTANTRRVVGTYGYMAPEYAMEGLFSVKSDVFSFGVIVLEIISGKRNSGFYLTGHAQTLLAYVWQLWKEGKEMEFVDPLLMKSSSIPQVVRCIHIGLLCVQEDPAVRPTMSNVVALLGSESIALSEPRQPPFPVGRTIVLAEQPSTKDPSVCHDLTVSTLSPR